MAQVTSRFEGLAWPKLQVGVVGLPKACLWVECHTEEGTAQKSVSVCGL